MLSWQIQENFQVCKALPARRGLIYRLTAHGTREKNGWFFALGHVPCTVFGPLHGSALKKRLVAAVRLH